MDEKIWYEDLKGFITQDNFLKFFPTPNMAYYEMINSIITIYIEFKIALLLLLY